jgi:FkbM family methyltransferase
VTIQSFKNKYKGKQVFMIGNGPSLKVTPLDRIQYEYSFAMNRISLIYDKVLWRPSFYICTTLNISRKEWRKDILETISLGIPCFVWDKLEEFIKPYHFKNVHFIKCTHGDNITDQCPDDWWSHDISKRVCKFGTSMLPALQIASYMGFNPIYLVGCDLGFQTAGSGANNNEPLKDIQHQKNVDSNHFDPKYGTPGCPANVLNINMKAAHELAFRTASRNGTKIFNATIGGQLEICPRVDFTKLKSDKGSSIKNTGKSESLIYRSTEVRHTTTVATKYSPCDSNNPPMQRLEAQSPSVSARTNNTKTLGAKDSATVQSPSAYVNLIDVGSAGMMPEPWASHRELIGKKLAFEPRDNESTIENVISISTTLWEKKEKRNFYTYRGLNGSGSSLFLQNYDFVLNNFDSLKSIGPSALAQTWLERSLPVAVNRVACSTLDSVLHELNLSDKLHFLKIDAQGAEYQILRGAENYLLNDCYGMQLELFTVPMYKEIKLYDEVVAYVNSLGFVLVKRFPPHGTFDSQCDCVFLRRDIEDDVSIAIRTIYGLPNLASSTPGDIKYPGPHKKKPKISQAIFSENDALFDKDIFKNLKALYKKIKNISQQEDPNTFYEEVENFHKIMRSYTEPEIALLWKKCKIRCLSTKNDSLRSLQGIEKGDDNQHQNVNDHIIYWIANGILKFYLPSCLLKVQCDWIKIFKNFLTTIEQDLHNSKIERLAQYLKFFISSYRYAISNLLLKFNRVDDSDKLEILSIHSRLAAIHIWQIGCIDHYDDKFLEILLGASDRLGKEPRISIEQYFIFFALMLFRNPSRVAKQLDSDLIFSAYIKNFKSSNPNIQGSIYCCRTFTKQNMLEEYALWYLENYSKISTYHNIHKGDSCFIIGNGPSLRKMDLSPLKHRITFGLNKIHLLFDKLGFETTYLAAANPYVIQQAAIDFYSLSMPMFIMMWGREFVQKKENVIFLRENSNPLFAKDITKGVCIDATVTYMAMQIAYYMGFKTVILIGVDHSFESKGQPHSTVRLSGEDPNHFDPNYFGHGVPWQLPDLEGSERAYQRAKKVFEADGRRILDATVEGELQIFEKISYQEALDLTAR